MKVDAGGYVSTIDQAGEAALEAERAGYDGWWVAETQIDPFLACAVAAERTERVELETAIAVAFARNPMTVALQANDIQALSGGRFVLGLGSQIKPHITKRYSMGLIDDEILHTFAIIGTSEQAIEELQRRCGDVVTRITLSVPPDRDEQRWTALFESLRGHARR